MEPSSPRSAAALGLLEQYLLGEPAGRLRGENRPDTLGVELVLHHVGLERRGVPGHQRVAARAERDARPGHPARPPPACLRSTICGACSACSPGPPRLCIAVEAIVAEVRCARPE